MSKVDEQAAKQRTKNLFLRPLSVSQGSLGNISSQFQFADLTKKRNCVILRENLLYITSYNMQTLPSKREKQILERVQAEGSVPIKKLAKALGVSAMTIHRDLSKLAAEGQVVKSHGEVLLPAPAKENGEVCAMCGKNISERTVFIISLKNGEQRKGCCPHCGLMLQAHLGKVWQAMTPDFLCGHMLTTNQAFYVLQSELSICCMPSVLSFGLKADAEKFAKGFGGTIMDMQEAIHFLQGTMHSHSGVSRHQRI